MIGNSAGTNTAGLLAAGTADANVALRSGATLLVSPLLFLPLTLSPSGITLPDDAGLYFIDVYLQALELDAGATGGMSFTPGLHWVLGFDLR